MLGACSKSSSVDPDKEPAAEVEGVKVDFPALGAAFMQASPELNQAVNDAILKIRYKHYPEALMQLDDTLKQPGLTDKQKKLVARVMDQLKEVLQTPGVKSN